MDRNCQWPQSGADWDAGFEWFQLYGTIESHPITKTGTNLPANGNAPLLSTGSVHVPSRRQAMDPKLLQGEIMFLS